MNDDAALAEIMTLLKTPGALKIITAEVRSGAVDLIAPSSFVCHDVVEIDGPDDQGRYIASSREGDWTLGYPAALLARLRQWRDG